MLLASFIAPRGKEVWQIVDDRECIDEVSTRVHILNEAFEDTKQYTEILAIRAECTRVNQVQQRLSRIADIKSDKQDRLFIEHVLFDAEIRASRISRELRQ